MRIWPAIDLRGGKCVRLQQGDYDRETVFGEDPLAMARHWVEQGAECLHLVDLDGARLGHPENMDAIRQIVSGVSVPCELGGGIRDEATITELLDLGVAQLVIGTRALREPEWFRQMCRQFPGKLVLGLDARNGHVATDGWLRTSNVPAVSLACQFEKEPLAAIVYTDISKDGMLAGPNLTGHQQLASGVKLPIIASGGVTTAADVADLFKLKLAGCIIGRSLYEGRITLADALANAQSHSGQTS